jgi:hypothetical protein
MDSTLVSLLNLYAFSPGRRLFAVQQVHKLAGQPILRQNEAIRQYLRARRGVEDVDPDTGEIDPNAPSSGPTPEGGAALPS